MNHADEINCGVQCRAKSHASTSKKTSAHPTKDEPRMGGIQKFSSNNKDDCHYNKATCTTQNPRRETKP